MTGSADPERRVAVVTGAASGLGAAAALRLAADGLVVIFADRNGPGAEACSAQASGEGHRAQTVDVTQEASVDALYQAALGISGQVDVLVCCAGGTVNTQSHQPPFAQTSLADWTRTEAVNARGTFLTIRGFLRQAGPHTRAGRIVATASAAAQRPSVAAGVSYSASKAAVLALVRSAALEGAPHGITANAVAPGPFDTPAFHLATSPERAQAQIKALPLRRIGRPEEFAALVSFLASAEAGYITGATLDINGGTRMA